MRIGWTDERQAREDQVGRAGEAAPGRGRVAVIGSGVAGLTAAYLLQRRYEVLLFEADERLGGHAHTHDVFDQRAGALAVDSGFIVHNERTYPTLLRLFHELGVSTQETEMSMSVRCLGCGLEYAGAKGPRGVFARGANLRDVRFLRMLGEIRRFHRDARRLLADTASPARELPPELAPDLTLGGFIERGGYSRYFADHFLIPLVSAVWSTGPDLVLRYPARYLFEFLDHHGMLSVTGSPRWRTVVGGSRTYVERAAKGLSAVNLSSPVRAVQRRAESVTVWDESGSSYEAERVVLATHPDQALRILADASTDERVVLGAIGYSRNETVLHTDASLLPISMAARSCWNYLVPRCATNQGPNDSGRPSERAVVTYHLNRLQRFEAERDYLVTMNATDSIDASTVIARMTYEHPVYTPASVAAQARLPELNTNRTAFAGAYHGWGFHEDGCASGAAAAAAFGAGW
jgi:predicted NAD/FAD-binding protein